MEHIFVESKILASMYDNQLTTDYIATNYKDIIPDYELIDSIKSDFEHLYCNKLSKIVSVESLICILHKYGITQYYKKLLEHIIWEIVRLNYDHKKFDFLCHDIIDDMINYNSDFTKILNYLIYKKKIKCKYFLKHPNLIALSLTTTRGILD